MHYYQPMWTLVRETSPCIFLKSPPSTSTSPGRRRPQKSGSIRPSNEELPSQVFNQLFLQTFQSFLSYFVWQINPRNATWLKDSVTSFSPGSSEAPFFSWIFLFQRRTSWRQPQEMLSLTIIWWLRWGFNSGASFWTAPFILMKYGPFVNNFLDSQCYQGMRRSRDFQKPLIHQELAPTTGNFYL